MRVKRMLGFFVALVVGALASIVMTPARAETPTCSVATVTIAGFECAGMHSEKIRP